jgi:hypothetical protein
MAKTRPDGSPLSPAERAAARGTPLTPAERAAEHAYWEQPREQPREPIEFPKAMLRFATTTDGRVKLNKPDGRPELETHPTGVATSSEEAEAKADGWVDNLQAAVDAAMKALQEQKERDREAEDRLFIDDEKRSIKLKKQARLEMATSGEASSSAERPEETAANRGDLIEACRLRWSNDAGSILTFDDMVTPTGKTRRTVERWITHGASSSPKFDRAIRRILTSSWSDVQNLIRPSTKPS